MNNTIIIKNGSGAPSNGVLQEAELGFDKTNNLLYIGNANGIPICLNEMVKGLAIDGDSGSLLWKGVRVATADDIPSIPTSLKNPNSLTVESNGTQSFTYDGSTAKTLNIKAGTNVSVSSDTSGNITISANNYTLPAATTSTLGGVIIGNNISVSSGTISLSSANVTGALGYTPLSTAGGTVTNDIIFTNGNGIMGKDKDGTSQYLTFLSSTNTLWFGYDMPSTYTAKFGVPIAGTLHLNNTTDASPTADNNVALIIGNRAGEHIVIDSNEIIPKNNGTTAGTLYLGADGCVISISGYFRLNGYSYGTSLPSAGYAGRVFFKKV